ncbi:MAG: CRP-like cAMP-binding protein [Sulfurimonas sp.]|jgi:CRP-like cAMP-binding protein
MKNLQDFFSLDDNDLATLQDFTHEKKHTKGEILFYTDEVLDSIYFLSEGTAIAYQVDNDYKKIVWHIFQAPCFIAEGFLLQDTPKPVAFTTEMLRDGKVCKINFKKFESFFLNRTDVLYKIVKGMTAKMSNYRHFVMNEKFFNSTEKVAFFIIHQPKLVRDLKLGEISCILNIQQPTLSKTLKDFRDAGLIESKKSKIFIKNEEGLREICKSKF